jgi:hypothetical protein
VTIALEALDSRYFLPQPGLDRAWLDGAIGDVLIRLDAMLPRFTATFPAASASHGRYESVERVDWTEGFWTGMLWLAWEVTGDEKYRAVAESLLDSFEERSIRKSRLILTTSAFSICSPALTPGNSPATCAPANSPCARPNCFIAASTPRRASFRRGEI